MTPFYSSQNLSLERKQAMFIPFTDEEAKVKKGLIICSKLTQLVSVVLGFEPISQDLYFTHYRWNIALWVKDARLLQA